MAITTYQALSIIPIRSKRNLSKANVVNNILEGAVVDIVATKTVKEVLYGELEDGNFVVMERNGFKNFTEAAIRMSNPEIDEEANIDGE